MNNPLRTPEDYELFLYTFGRLRRLSFRLNTKRQGDPADSLIR
jgi:hypothetical protein